MNVHSDKLNCYIEGIRIPIKGIDVQYTANTFSRARIQISCGGIIHPKMWANALIHVTYLETDNLGFKKEKLFFEGLATELEIIETSGLMTITAESKWSVMNFNTTLDYVAPKRYGINKVNEEIKIYIGNEEVVEIDNGGVDNYQMSFRYFFLPLEYQDNKTPVEKDSPESFKLQYIVDRTPMAEKLAYSFFEDISYFNFDLSKAYIDRFNLLNKVGDDSERSLLGIDTESILLEATGQLLDIDPSRSGLFYLLKKQGLRQGEMSEKTLEIGPIKIDVEKFFTKLPFDKNKRVEIEFLLSKLSNSTRLTTSAEWAYVLATVKHETAHTYRPIEEYGKGAGRNYSGGSSRYYGRGYVQITHDYNYEYYGNLIGTNLKSNPTLATDPEVAWKILDIGMSGNGGRTFTSKPGLSTFVNKTPPDFYNARTIVNGHDKADVIKGYAEQFLQAMQ